MHSTVGVSACILLGQHLSVEKAKTNRHGHICTEGLSETIRSKLATILDKTVHTGHICAELGTWSRHFDRHETLDMENELPKRPDFFCHIGSQGRWIIEDATSETYSALKGKKFTALYSRQ